jgi:predicted AlkP superfamily phosphohydrolase/phosphomutase
MLPVYDWENTRAFSLPTDQYGWIRINLIGREAQGSVPLDRYSDTCAQLEQLMLGLTNEDGQSLVQDVTRTCANAESALSNPLPDLVVRWQDAAFAWPLRIKGSISGSHSDRVERFNPALSELGPRAPSPASVEATATEFEVQLT